MREPTLCCSIVLVTIASGCTENVASLDREAIPRSDRAVIRVDTIEPPTLIAYRLEGSATWQPPTPTGAARFEFGVDGPYRVTVVCDELDNGQVTVRQIARTSADPQALELACDTEPSPHVVTGRMAQAGSVRLGTAAAGSRRDHWQFALGAAPGEAALVAYTNDRLAVRRPLAVTGDIALAQEIDLNAEGHALEPVTLVPTNLDGTETEMTSIVWLDFEDTLAFLWQPLTATKVAPNALLTARDLQTVTLAIHSPTVGRTVTRPFRLGDPTTFPLPEPLGPVDFHGLSVTWSTLPAFDTLEVSFDAFSFTSFTFQQLHLELSASFIAATGITSAALDTADIPGFRAEWLVDTSQPHHRFAGVLQTLPNGDLVGSDVSQDVDGSGTPVARAPSRRPGTTHALPVRSLR